MVMRPWPPGQVGPNDFSNTAGAVFDRSLIVSRTPVWYICSATITRRERIQDARRSPAGPPVESAVRREAYPAGRVEPRPGGRPPARGVRAAAGGLRLARAHAARRVSRQSLRHAPFEHVVRAALPLEVALDLGRGAAQLADVLVATALLRDDRDREPHEREDADLAAAVLALDPAALEVLGRVGAREQIGEAGQDPLGELGRVGRFHHGHEVVAADVAGEAVPKSGQVLLDELGELLDDPVAGREAVAVV